MARLGIETGGRLIEQHDVGLVVQGTIDDHSEHGQSLHFSPDRTLSA
jgi:hypothetical protein